MQFTIATIAIAAFALNAAAWEFSFSDTPGCLFTGDTVASGNGNQACTAVTAGDDDDHVDITGLGNCIISFYEDAGCSLALDYDAFDEDDCEEFEGYRPAAFDVTQC
ncbi:uncharacterized protein RCC_08935 [Ramularia collo-cygni]|uniref:Uncharacterized protein n=1 Tax=Ramularia collo-cygni TaxID=112498 RepID=A0A2D3VL64_9PEZI|nr:uncharacterized protein RCC_08935 [Ramularia collo-cygni]CZT23224.1 uncharacterized protein RCC_08935 [Ramularia collo-cygni]